MTTRKKCIVIGTLIVGAAAAVLLGYYVGIGKYAPSEQAAYNRLHAANNWEFEGKTSDVEDKQVPLADKVAQVNVLAVQKRTLDAQIGHPELTNCRTQPGKDKDGKPILVSEPCPGGVSAAIYRGKEAVITVQLLTYSNDELPLNVAPTLVGDEQLGGTAVPLGNNRFRVSGLVYDQEKIAGGYKIRVTPEGGGN